MIKLVSLAIVIATAFTACPDDEFCLACTDNNICSICVNAYANDNGVCVQGDGETVENCFTFASATTCQTCNEGYYVSEGKCVEIAIDNCASVNSDEPTVCTACDNGKIPSNGNCEDGADCELDNCDICKSATECFECDDSHVLTEDGTCVEESVDHCRQRVDGACFMCERGYYDASGSCEETDVQGNTAILSAFVSLIAVIKMMA